MKEVLLPVACSILWTSLAFGQAVDPMPVPAQQALVEKYCAGCHNDRTKRGGFSWRSIDLAAPGKTAEQSERAIRQLWAGSMPPAGMPRPDAATIQQFAGAMEMAIDRAASSKPYAGAPDLHRLNRTEYRNSIRDVLGVDIDVSALLPPDDSSQGFDNIADSLSITPALVQAYVRAAGKISREAIGDLKAAPTTLMYSVPRVVNQMHHVDGAPLGTRGGVSIVTDLPADGEYTFKLKLYYDYLETLYGQHLPPNILEQQIEISVDGARAALFTINPNLNESENNMTTGAIRITAGPHRISAAFIARFDGPTEDEFRQVEQSMVDVSAGIPGLIALPHLQTLTITGPYKVEAISSTPSRRKIFSCVPTSESEELSCAQRIVTALARQAYRRPVTAPDTEFLMGYYREGRKDGGFEDGVRMAVQAIIANPKFLFRFENQPAGKVPGENYRITDLDLATRLSFFLWSSLPDERLIALASEGKLSDPEILRNEVRRMLADRRSDALADNFAAQWLRLPSLKEADPDAMLFPNFTRNLADSMIRETKLLFESIMREDRNITDLLTSNYTFVDETLARHYGIPGVHGSNFRRVEWKDPNRFGLLGQGSFLTLTSLANRTSPVARGKYVMEVLLGVTPPPPPPGIPLLVENLTNQKPQPVRARLEMHRSVEPCASCHKMMDPIGLSLENFDAVGVWRANDSGSKIDAKGQLFDGTALDGPISLRNAILNHSHSFIGVFSENLTAYGLGRLLKPADMPAVRAIEREAAQNNNRFSTFVIGIVQSAAFQMRQAE